MSAIELVRALTEKGMMIGTAESCTGGLVAAAITDVAGSSEVFDRGFVTYSNEAKTDMLGVPVELISKHGAVSAEVARAMAEGVLRQSRANVSISITGIAGPSGWSELKPVGLVHFSCATTAKTVYLEKRFGDLGRDGVRAAAVQTALQLVLDCI